jgi:multicomponent Na+:H+ antiporter subunit E
MYQIILANIYMVKVVLHPRMRDVIFPHVVKFNTRLKGDLSITTFANSITLTPGTITIKVEDNVFYVHAIDEKVAASLPGDMERKVGQIFKGA